MERKISKKEARKQGVWGEVRGQFANRFFKGRVYSRTFVPSYLRTSAPRDLSTKLPEWQTLILGDEHLVTLFHAECLIPGIDVGQSTIDAPALTRQRPRE